MTMKTRKPILLLFLLAAVIFTVPAAKKNAHTIFHKTVPTGNGGVARRPIQMPVDVMFDSESLTVEVICNDTEIEGEVYIYNRDGNLEGYSPTLNSTFQVSTSGLYTITILGEGWSGDGYIEI